MKKFLLYFIASFVCLNAAAQGSCATPVTITTNGTIVCPVIAGTYPTGTGLCFAGTAAAPKANWYKFTPTQSGTLTVGSNIAPNVAGTATTSGVDSRLSILTGSCAGPFTCVASNDDTNEAGFDYRSLVSNVTVAAGTTYYIVWDNRWQSTTFSFQLTFTPQTCFKPTNYTLTALSTTTAGLSWTAPTSGTPTGYQFEYGMQGFTQGTGTVLSPAGTSISLTGLTASTVYDFYVRTNCGSGDFSVWDGPFTINTVFTPATAPYNTGFENNQMSFIGWSSGITANDWFISTGLAQQGTSAAAVFSNSAAQSNARLYSRGVNLTANSQASINYYVRNYVAGTPISTNTAGYILSVGSAPVAASQTIVLATETGISDVTYVSKTYTFTPTTTGTYFFSFLHNSPINAGGVHAFLLDNFTVTQVLSNESYISNKFSISPNPTLDFVNISSADNIGVNAISVADINGRIVKELVYKNVTDVQVNISDLASGMYIMSIKSEQGIATKKIVKN